ncbi:MAG: hypothetical protein DI562_06065 [Stenotrophomonas acidaminiphila]|nr:MAG: hypothetical protein DI562_06065 [Stenotrophomonas acidaminiphila]
MRIADITPPTAFKIAVEFPIPGAGKTSIDFTVRWRNKPAVVILLEKMKEMTDAQTLLEVVTGWELEDEVNAETITEFCDTFPQAPVVILTRYFKELGVSIA